jgi:hypothetical protein
MLLQWMDHPGADGLPLKGTAVVLAAQAPAMTAPDPIPIHLDPLQKRGKTEVMLQFQARNSAKEGP